MGHPTRFFFETRLVAETPRSKGLEEWSLRTLQPPRNRSVQDATGLRAPITPTPASSCCPVCTRQNFHLNSGSLVITIRWHFFASGSPDFILNPPGVYCYQYHTLTQLSLGLSTDLTSHFRPAMKDNETSIRLLLVTCYHWLSSPMPLADPSLRKLRRPPLLFKGTSGFA
jgi:hypothetical protein